MENKVSFENPIDYKTPNSLAAVWSMMLPGLGQLMKGRVLPGILWALFTASGYFAYFWPGLILHLFCVLDAAFYKGDSLISGNRNWMQKILFLSLIAFLITYIIYRN